MQNKLKLSIMETALIIIATVILVKHGLTGVIKFATDLITTVTEEKKK